MIAKRTKNCTIAAAAYDPSPDGKYYMFTKKKTTTTDLARNLLESRGFETNISFSQAQTVIGSSFAGTTPENMEQDLRFMIQPFDLEDSSSIDKRRELSTWVMGFPVYEVMYRKKGLVFGIEQNGVLQAVVCLNEFDSQKDKSRGAFASINNSLWDVRTYMAMPVPDLVTKRKYKKAQKEFDRRVNTFREVMPKAHGDYGPTGKHWYIQAVGVRPDAQGRGYGGKMMRALSRVADELGIACYLESAENNRAFYEKLGYKVAGQETITSRQKDSIDVFFMVREPCSSSLVEN